MRGDLAVDVIGGFVSEAREGEGGGEHGAEWRPELMAESRTESRAELNLEWGSACGGKGMGG
jgi:hypothetical protein